jgi:opacity protein-like surface antigen
MFKNNLSKLNLMKRTLLIILVLIISFPAVNAQFTKVGGGAGFTTGYHFHDMNYDYNKSGMFNFYLNGIYELKLPIHIAPSVTFFIPHVWKSSDVQSESKVTVTTLMFDINGHFVFNSLDRFELYGLAGIDILLAWKKDVSTIVGTAPSTQTFKESDNALGLNLGIGTYMKLAEKVDLNFEAKYLVSHYHQFMFNAGVLINLQYIIKHKKEPI